MCELIEGETGSFGCSDSVFGSLGKLKSADSHSLRDVKESDIIGDSSNDCDDAFELVLSFELWVSVFGKMFGNAGDGDGVTVKSGLVKTFVDDLIEFIVSPSGEE